MKGHVVRSTIFLSVHIQFTYAMPSGYLPPDKRIRDWMLSHKYHDKEETTEWLRGFLHALLCVTFGEVEAPLLTRTKGRRTLLVCQIRERHCQLTFHLCRRMTETERPQSEKTRTNEHHTSFF
jgi:hypothetical protein